MYSLIWAIQVCTAPKCLVFLPFWSEIEYVNWICFLEEGTSSSFGDKTISLLMFMPTLYVR